MLYPKVFDQKEWTLCYHKNETQSIQLLQVKNIHDWYFEKLLLPNEWVVFEAPEMAQLEIHYQSPMDRISPDIFPCSRLQVKYEMELDSAIQEETKVISINKMA